MTISPLPCGCEIIPRDWGRAPMIAYCPLHAAAPALVEALKAVSEALRDLAHDKLCLKDSFGVTCHKLCEEARAALSIVEGGGK